MGRKFYNIFRKLGMLLPVECVRIYEILHEKRLNRRYHKNAHRRIADKPTVICMVNGRTHHAGLADRLNGILSCYQACKELDYDFKINFSSPFNLTDYLVPNKHDWIIDNNAIYDNKASAVFIRALIPPRNKKRKKQLINAIRKSKTDQIHIYSNLKCVSDSDMPKLFKELFCPSNRLKTDIDKHLKKLGSTYISVSFRFQQLLGDFIDLGAESPLNETDKKNLIYRCIQSLESLYRQKCPPESKILVASDSITFLKEASKLKFTYIVPGDISHAQFTDGNNTASHYKTFLDLMLIANATESYIIKGPGMHESGFPKLASSFGGHKIETLSFT